MVNKKPVQLEQISITLPPYVLREMTDYCKKNDLKRSVLLRKFVIEGYEKEILKK